jgi:protein-disulfide isomerase
MCQAVERVGLSCTGATKGRWTEVSLPIPVPSTDFTIAMRPVVIPVAFLGLAYFVFMGVWFAFIGRPRPYGYTWYLVPLVLGLCGGAVSLFFLGAMAFRVAPPCLWCLVVHVVNFLMVQAIRRLCAGATSLDTTAAPASSAVSPRQVARTILTSREVVTVAAFSLILIVGLWAYRRERLALQDRYYRLLPYRHLITSLREDPEFLLREYYAQPQHQIPARPQEPVAEGQPRLVVFTDFECSACYCNSVDVREQIARTFNGRLAVLIRHYPLCSACNENVRGARHANACEAAYAAEAARLQGGEEAFWKMYTLLFEHRTGLGKGPYRDLATQIGLDADRLLRDMEQETVRQIVAADIALAKELGVTGAPTMFLDGRRVTELCRGTVFWKTVAKILGPSPDGARDAVAEVPDGLSVSRAANETRR